MTLKKLWVYLSILVVVAGLWAASEFIFPKKTEESKSPSLFPNLQADEIQEIEWQRGTEIVHLKKNKSWEIIRPISVPADVMEVEDTIRNLTTLSPERRLPVSGPALKEFGLDSPRVKLLFLTRGKWFEIQVGNKTAVGNDYYVRTSHSPDLFLIQEFAIKNLDKDLLSLREKKVFSFNLNQVQSIEIHKTKKAFSLERGPKGWNIKNRKEAVLNKNKVESFLADLLWLKVKGFAQAGTEKPEWGLKNPVYQIRLRNGGKGAKEEILFLGKEEPSKGVCAKSTIHKEVVFLDPAILKKIPQGPEEWEDKAPSPSVKKDH